MDLNGKETYFTANNSEELLYALNNKEPYIIISREYKNEFLETTELSLTENELMGLELGFRGTASLWGEIFYQIINLFSKDSKEKKKIDSKIRKYSIKKRDENDFLLYLRQFDY
ncbi:hypothetical protein [Paucisalibacillus globulus]|uniref:hypothetical protein n=1 Tax=Paucisalibacillus globulus TaxID=351095 RepID=UPI0020D09E38|nr:hypothetical protein [Paucisalibacillus globulus]